ncbi:MAG: hypothetical protein DYG98_10015 [Haliscomenobacteraceae bacterium CHB4]|nr:hypothetical protein [Saprospiraceae bacterium]MCE7923383.1 hypothetical protein [Haliscomenobacteraceae bacterium CHB4]
MNKKLLLLGVSALVAGFFTFSAFDKKTREQQMAEIEQMVTMKLDELRAQKEQECTDKINTEAQRRFDEILAQRAAEAAAKPGKKPSGGKKTGGSKGPSVEPLPQPSAPPTDPKKDKMEGGANTQEKKEKMQGAPTSTEKKKEKMKSGGGN